MKVPCKDCTERKAGCHSACEKYREWKAGHEVERKIINQKKLEAKNYYDYKANQINKTKKR